MSDCRKCAEFDWCVENEDCGLFKLKPMTNADRIRSMTDEELANCITDDLCDRVCHSPLSCDGNCEIQVLAWLKQEAVDNAACSDAEPSKKVKEDE